ncbi:lymphoid-restricted membrane protein-like [Lingula anatina]|uniref:Lymphoid-restricted membrane protein-like n=1 Tax=Lingula anatina TaxID=7574 RepID=A0A1S3I062_LINAN|nr:lymphoid-restricted membrane protein-like [Lingula anatina]|eukprot:XP_013391650.1 lymphoid-restricted membrane protein-like [Lingula anatina]
MQEEVSKETGEENVPTFESSAPCTTTSSSDTDSSVTASASTSHSQAKFNQLALAFKTDKTTVEKRLELQGHIRSVAEDSILNEIGDMKNSIEMLGLLCTDQESRDLYNAVQKHVEVVEYSTLRMSGHAELHGAVKQECRLSKAVDSMVQYVENLKRLHEKLSTELDETKRILKDNKIMCPSLSSDLGDSVLLRRTTTLKFTPPTHRTKSLPSSLTAVNYIPVTDKKEVNGPNARRRASVAALPRMLGGTGGVGFSASSPVSK